jgi:hypothetical protein
VVQEVQADQEDPVFQVVQAARLDPELRLVELEDMIYYLLDRL